jgi:hypothetical protein
MWLEKVLSQSHNFMYFCLLVVVNVARTTNIPNLFVAFEVFNVKECTMPPSL